MLSLFRTLSLRYLRLHWVRAGLVIASIALGVATWVTTETIYLSVSRSLGQAASPLRGGADQLYVTNFATRFIDASLGERLEQEVPGIAHAEPLILENVLVRRASPAEEGNDRPNEADAILIGLELPREQAEKQRLASRDIEIIDLDEAKLQQLLIENRLPDFVIPPFLRPFARRAFERFSGRVPVLVGEELDRDFLKGEKTLLIEADRRQLKAAVVGRVRARGPAALVGGQAVLSMWQPAARLLGRPDQVHRLDLTLDPSADRDEVIARARAVVGSKASVQTAEDQDRRLRHVLKGLETGFRMCGAGALIVGLFLVYNSMSVSVAERRHDIGILRSVGATRVQVRVLFMSEALLLGLVGALLGVPLGILLSHLLLGPIQEGLSGVFLPMRDREVIPDLQLFASAVLGGVLTSLLAALVPASKAAAEEPADAVRRAPPSVGLAYRLLQVGGSLTLVLLGVFLIAVKPYLTPDLVQSACTALFILGVVLTLLGYHLSSRTAPEADSPADYRSLRSMVYGLVFVAVGIAGYLMRHSLAAEKGAYAALGLILLGSLLLTPLLAAFLTRLLSHALRDVLPIPSRLAADNLVRSPGRTGLVIAALTAGVALTVQTAGTIRSNESAYREWIDRTIKADLYFRSGGPVSSTAQLRSLSPRVGREVRDQLQRITGSDDVRVVGMCYRYPEWGSANRHGASASSGSKQDDTLIFMTLIDSAEHYRATRGRGQSDAELDLWRQLSEDRNAVIISDNFALLHNVAVGEKIVLGAEGGPVELTIIGTVPDYNWIRGSIWVDRPSNAGRFSADEVNAWDVYLPASAAGQAAEVRDRLQKSPVGARHRLIGFTRDEVRDGYLEMIRQVYGMAYTQEVLVGIVAVLGVVMALLISVLSRQRELGLLRAVGATRWQVVHTVLAEAVLIGLVGAVLGIVIGLPLEWYVVRVILVEEAGFLFPVRIAWVETLVITLLAVFSATVAGLAPAFRAVRLRIADAIAYE